jgi:hypothetical protein
VHGGYFLSEAEADRLSQVVATPPHNTLNPAIVGKPAKTIARMAGIYIPPDTRCLIAEIGGVGPNFPSSMEKLSPILAFYVEEGTERAATRCLEVRGLWGNGPHRRRTHALPRSRRELFGQRMPISRATINTPAAHGAIGLSTAHLRLR